MDTRIILVLQLICKTTMAFLFTWPRRIGILWNIRLQDGAATERVPIR